MAKPPARTSSLIPPKQVAPGSCTRMSEPLHPFSNELCHRSVSLRSRCERDVLNTAEVIPYFMIMPLTAAYIMACISTLPGLGPEAGGKLNMGRAEGIRKMLEPEPLGSGFPEILEKVGLKRRSVHDEVCDVLIEKGPSLSRSGANPSFHWKRWFAAHRDPVQGGRWERKGRGSKSMSAWPKSHSRKPGIRDQEAPLDKCLGALHLHGPTGVAAGFGWQVHEALAGAIGNARMNPAVP